MEGTHVIDMGDISAFPDIRGGKVSNAGVLAHEIKEGFEMQVGTGGTKKSSHASHRMGFGAQSSVDGIRILNSASFNSTSPTSSQLSIPVITRGANNQGVNSTIQVNFRNNDITTITNN